MDIKVQIEGLVSERQEKITSRIKSYIRKDLHREIPPEEILSETICYLLRHPSVGEQLSREELYRLLLWKARHLVCDRIHKLRNTDWALRSGALDLPEASFGAERATQASPTVILHREDKRKAIRHTIDLLPNGEQKTALRLVKIENRTNEEAAKIMGKSPEAVRKLAERGFQQLATVLRSFGKSKFESSGETT